MLRIIAEQGPHAAPMSQIAKEAGVATGTIYHHFKSKEDILNELYVNLKNEFGSLLTNKIDTTKPFKEQFYSLWRLLYEYYVSNPQAYHFVEQVAKTAIISNEVREIGKQYYQPIINLFQIGVDQGIIRTINLELMAQIIYGNVITTAQLAINEELEINDKLLNEAISISWRGIINI